MGLEKLTQPNARSRARTVKALKVPPDLVAKILEISKALKKSFNLTLLELADEGTKAYYLYKEVGTVATTDREQTQDPA